MATIHSTHDRRSEPRRSNRVETMTPREQLLGMLALIFVLLLAMLLQSM